VKRDSVDSSGGLSVKRNRDSSGQRIQNRENVTLLSFEGWKGFLVAVTF
jgi:hypothetical protein